MLDASVVKPRIMMGGKVFPIDSPQCAGMKNTLTVCRFE